MIAAFWATLASACQCPPSDPQCHWSTFYSGDYCYSSGSDVTGEYCDGGQCTSSCNCAAGGQCYEYRCSSPSGNWFCQNQPCGRCCPLDDGSCYTFECDHDTTQCTNDGCPNCLSSQQSCSAGVWGSSSMSWGVRGLTYYCCPTGSNAGRFCKYESDCGVGATGSGPTSDTSSNAAPPPSPSPPDACTTEMAECEASCSGQTMTNTCYISGGVTLADCTCSSSASSSNGQSDYLANGSSSNIEGSSSNIGAIAGGAGVGLNSSPRPARELYASWVLPLCTARSLIRVPPPLCVRRRRLVGSHRCDMHRHLHRPQEEEPRRDGRRGRRDERRGAERHL